MEIVLQRRERRRQEKARVPKPYTGDVVDPDIARVIVDEVFDSVTTDWDEIATNAKD